MILALSMALADDARPAPPPPAPGDCATVEVLRPGPTTRTCSSLSIPPAEYADLLALEAWGEHIADLRRLEAAACADDVERVAERADYWRGLAERPAPTVHPAVVFGAGVGAGVVAVLGGALAVRWATGADVTPGD